MWNHFQGMELKETDKKIVSRPVPTRPCSSFKFTEHLASPAPLIAGTNAINSVTVELKHAKTSPTEIASYTESKPCSISLTTTVADYQSCAIYKPIPVAISRNGENFDASNPGLSADTQSPFQDQLINHALQGHDKANSFKDPLHHTEETTDCAQCIPGKVQEEFRGNHPSSSADRSYFDGYYWRKYGQKQVKGSEYPRSYYKCSHPGCSVRKKVETSGDGKIAEIVYEGEHNHSKPQPLKWLRSGKNASVPSEGNRSGCSSLSRSSFHADKKGPSKNSKGEELLSETIAYTAKFQSSSTYSDLTKHDIGARNSNTLVACFGESEFAGSTEASTENDRLSCKKRKKANQFSTEGGSSHYMSDFPAALQTPTESDIHADGFRWRKYGQKVVKGNLYPRNYYRCIHPRCDVRKHIERASDGPNSYITTYEGRHNHDIPSHDHA